MKTIPKIAVIGGGIGGLVCASELKYRLGSKAQITVFDRSAHHVYQPAFLHLALGQRKLDSIRRPLDRLVNQGIKFLHGEVFRIDAKNLVVNSEHGDFEFDHIVTSLGAKLDVEGVNGFKENALNLYSAEGAQQIKEALSGFSGGKIALVITGKPFKCPAAPYEMAFLLESYFRKKKIRDKVELKLITVEPSPLTTAGPEAGKLVIQMLEDKEIEFFSGEQVKSIGQYVSFGKKRTKADLVIGVPPHKCPDVLIEAGLAKKDGWVKVDKQSLKTEFENVYSIGDSNAISLANGNPLPKAGVMAKGQAQIVAYNLAHKLNKGKVDDKKFQGKGGCFIEVGDNKAAYAKGLFYNEPDPVINMKDPSRVNYAFKMLYEKYWLNAWL